MKEKQVPEIEHGIPIPEIKLADSRRFLKHGHAAHWSDMLRGMVAGDSFVCGRRQLQTVKLHSITAGAMILWVELVDGTYRVWKVDKKTMESRTMKSR